MSVPWTPLLGDIQSPGSLSSLAEETAARIAADAVLQAEITAGGGGAVSSVFGRVGAVTKQFGDYDFADLDNLPSNVAGYGITDVYTKSQSDALYQTPQTTLSGYGITDAFTMLQSDSRYMPNSFSWLFSDQVIRADNASAPGGKFVTWLGTYGVSAGRIVCTTSGNADVAAIDTGASDMDVSGVVVAATTFGDKAGMIFRGTDITNYMSVFINAGNSIQFCKATVSGFIGSVIIAIPDATYPTLGGVSYLLRIRVVGSSVKVWINGTLIINYTMTGPEAATYTGTFSGFVSLNTSTNKFGPFMSGSRPVQTLADYNISDAYTKTVSDGRFAPIAVPFASITGLPSTLAGYGIGDAYTKTTSDSRFIRDIPILGSDTFPQTVGTALAALATGQSWVMWNGAWVASGANQAKENASVRDAALVWDTGLAEQDWSIYVNTGTPTVGQMGCICRGVSAGNYIFSKWTNGNLTINKMVAGVVTQLATIASVQVVNVVYKMRIIATGNVITVKIDAPTGTSGTALSYTLVGAEIATFGASTFVGLYLSASSGTNAGYLFSNVAFRNYLNTQVTLDARYLKIDELGQSVAPNAPNGGTTIAFNVGSQLNQGAFKAWGQVLLGNNNDQLSNSTGSGVLHMGSSGGTSIGLANGTVHLKTTTAAGVVIPVLPLVLTTGNAPALSSSTGAVGQLAWANGFFYVCVAANTWQRVAIATF